MVTSMYNKSYNNNCWSCFNNNYCFVSYFQLNCIGEPTVCKSKVKVQYIEWFKMSIKKKLLTQNGYFEFQNIWMFSLQAFLKCLQTNQGFQSNSFLVLVWLSSKNNFIPSPLGFHHKREVEHWFLHTTGSNAKPMLWPDLSYKHNHT